MVNCCVPLCTSNQRNNNGKGIRFHEIPSAKNLRDKWLAAISRQGAKKGSKWFPSDYSRVCSLHFQTQDYRENCKIKILKPGVVPSVFTEYPSYLQPPKKKSRKEPVTTRQSIVNEAGGCGDVGLQHDDLTVEHHTGDEDSILITNYDKGNTG